MQYNIPESTSYLTSTYYVVVLHLYLRGSITWQNFRNTLQQLETKWTLLQLYNSWVVYHNSFDMCDLCLKQMCMKIWYNNSLRVKEFHKTKNWRTSCDIFFTLHCNWDVFGYELVWTPLCCWLFKANKNHHFKLMLSCFA